MSFLAAFLALLVQDAPQISGEPPCRRSETIRATVAQIGRDPGRFVERCVRVSGLLYQHILHDDRDSLYLARRNSWDGGPMRSPTIHHLRVDGPFVHRLDDETPVPATVVGRIDTCEQRRRRPLRLGPSAPGEIIVSSFHCYAANGQLIVASDARVGHGQVERMTGESMRPRFGNLSPMPVHWPGRARIEGLVQQFGAALQSGDRELAGSLHGIRVGSRAAHSEQGRRLFAHLFDDPDSPWAPFRSAPSSQVAFFVPELEDGERYPPGNRAAIACFCRTRDCRDRWPLSAIDIRYQPGRPYACTIVYPRNWVPNGFELETDPRRSGPVEPARTAVR